MVGGKKGRAGYRGKFPSIKLGRIVLYKLLLVRDYLYLLEFDPDVVTYQETPFEITYSVPGGVLTFTPDLLVCRACGRRQLLKLSYDEIPADGEAARRLRALARACGRLGYEFRLVPASAVLRQPFLGNVKALWKYASEPVDAPQHQLLCLEFFSRAGAAPLGDLIEFFESRGESARAVFALIFRGVLRADMNAPLNRRSLIIYPGAACAAMKKGA